MVKPNRGRVAPTPHPAPNSEPTFLPEPPKRLVFGQHQTCTFCKGKGKKRGAVCRLCGGTGVIGV